MQVYSMCVEIQKHLDKLGLDAELQQAVSSLWLARWNWFHSPLHAAAYMLEPQFRLAEFSREVMHLC